MKRRSLSVALLLFLLSFPLALSATDLLFVFHEDSPAASVYDAGRLRLLATPTVGWGASQAFGVPDPATPGEFRKYYVTSGSSIVILNPDLAVRGTLFLPGRPASGTNAAALSPDGRRLLVASGGLVYLIDTSNDSILATLDPGFTPSGLVVLPGSEQAYVIGVRHTDLRIIDLQTSQLSDSRARMPVALTALASAPNGSKIYATSPGSLYDLNKLAPSFFRPLPDADFSLIEHPASPTPLSGLAVDLAGQGEETLAALLGGGRPSIDKLLLSNGDDFLMQVAGKLFFGQLPRGGAVAEVINPATGRPFQTNAVADIALAPDGMSAFVALRAEEEIVRLDPEGRTEASVLKLSSAPTAVALVAPKVDATATLTAPAGTSQTVSQNSGFNLLVEGPAGGVTVTVTPLTTVVSCDATKLLDITTGMATISCSSGSVTTTTTVQVLVNVPTAPIVGSVTFNVTIEGPTSDNGLSKISGDNQSVVQNQNFQMVVEAKSGATPQQGLTLTVTAPGASPVDCPGSVVTAANGRATITCEAEPVATATGVSITVTDGTRTVTFSVTILVSASGLTKVAGDSQSVPQNTAFADLRVDAFSGTTPQNNLRLAVLPTPGAPTVDCDDEVFTNTSGRATIRCFAGPVATNTSVQIVVTDGARAVTFNATILVSGTVEEGLTKISGDNQIVAKNSPLALPLVVRAVKNGIPQQNLKIDIDVDASPGILFCNSSALTDINGLGSFICTTGTVTSVTFVRAFVTDPEDRNLPEPFRITITPEQLGTADDLVRISAEMLQARVGETLTDAVRVEAVDTDGDSVPGAIVFFSSSANVEFAPPVASADANGEARASVTFGCPPGPGTIRVGLEPNGSNVLINFVAQSGALAAMEKLQGDNQSGAPGQLLNQQALVVRLTDECGTRLSGVAVGWTVDPPNAATLESVFNVTDGQGRSSVLVRLGNRGGAFRVIATSGNISAIFNLSVTNPPTQLVQISGNGQTAAIGETAGQPLVVEAQGDNGAGVQGVEVTFAVVGGFATLSTTSATTDAQGRASTTVQIGGTLGPVTVEARAIGRAVQFLINTIGRTPTATLLGFVNAASFRQGWVPGSLASIFGTGLMEGIDGVVEAGQFPFPTQLRGVRVLVEGIAAPIFAIANVNGQEQINLQVPFQIRAPGTVTVVIENNGSSTIIPGVPVVAVQPGIFEFTLGGQRLAAALHRDFKLVTPANPARPGETILLFLTGLGAIDPAVPTNTLGPTRPLSSTVLEPTVGIDNVGMVTLGSFYAPLLTGVFQINFRVGPDVQSGNRSLNVVIGGTGSQRVLLPVQR